MAEQLAHEMSNAEAAALEYRVSQRDQAIREIQTLLAEMGLPAEAQLRIDGRKVFVVTPVGETEHEPLSEPSNGRVLYPVGAE